MDNLNPAAGIKAPKTARHVLFWTAIGYGLLAIPTIAGFLLIRSYGETLSTPPATVAVPLAAADGKTDILLHLLLVLGALMNTRGLMELIVLNIGLDLGVISPTLFAMMVLMALVTTMATAPLLRLLKLPQDGNGK